MRIFFSIIFLFLACCVFCQPTKREIIEKKVKAITSVFYEPNGKKELVVKNYYSVNGCDSLEFFNNQPSFYFFQELDKFGRVVKLFRKDSSGKQDEVHLYKYYPDNTYSIEIIAHGAGTISFKSFNGNHDCFQEIISSTDTFLYVNNPLGKIKKIQQMVSGEIIDIAVSEFDSSGYPTITKSLQGNSLILRYKYKEIGLLEELEQLIKASTGEDLARRIMYSYEFNK